MHERTTTSHGCVQVLATALVIYNCSVPRDILYLVRHIKMHFREDFAKNHFVTSKTLKYLTDAISAKTQPTLAPTDMLED